MNIFGKKKLTLKQNIIPDHLFIEPLVYAKTSFGIKTETKDETVKSYLLGISATQMKKNFKVVEDISSIHEWPFSKLMQRKFDKQKVTMMSRDYLLSNGYLKYFPPLTAVCIPMNRNHLPDDAYSDTTDNEIPALKNYIFQCFDAETANFVNNQSAIASGIYDIHDGEQLSGYLVWDEHKVSAVIIDGQHRYKALLEAMNINKDFQRCRVTVNLIDLVSLCRKNDCKPASVLSDLLAFVN